MWLIDKCLISVILSVIVLSINNLERRLFPLKRESKSRNEDEVYCILVRDEVPEGDGQAVYESRQKRTFRCEKW